MADPTAPSPGTPGGPGTRPAPSKRPPLETGVQHVTVTQYVTIGTPGPRGPQRERLIVTVPRDCPGGAVKGFTVTTHAGTPVYREFGGTCVSRQLADGSWVVREFMVTYVVDMSGRRHAVAETVRFPVEF